MSDIDFDELDKAVNNLMGRSKSFDDVDVNKKDDSKTPVGDNQPDTPQQELPQGTEENDESKATDEENGVEHAPKVAQLPRRSGGRFMDVVHPSGDMRAKGGSASGMPAISKISAPMQRDTGQSMTVDDEPPQTPFLPDANEKVEKRPLGSKSWTAGKSDEGLDDSRASSGQNDDDTRTGLDVSTQKVEGEDDGHTDSSLSNAEEERGQDQRPLNPTDFEVFSEEERRLQEIESREISQPVEHDDAATSDGDTKQAGTIYDTDAYHQPLSQPKQKSGWGTVIIIILVIAVCVGLGVAAYLFLGGNFRLG